MNRFIVNDRYFFLVSIMCASGDDGVASYPIRFNPSFCGYEAMFPAVSPYVTAVGGTMVRNLTYHCKVLFYYCVESGIG